jgi:hypothetical protein
MIGHSGARVSANPESRIGLALKRWIPGSGLPAAGPGMTERIVDRPAQISMPLFNLCVIAGLVPATPTIGHGRAI